MLDERAAGIAVLAAPFDVGDVEAVALDEKLMPVTLAVEIVAGSEIGLSVKPVWLGVTV